jgi:hypothetical protein
MNNYAGIITVAYGQEYDKCAAHTLYHSRQFTDLPFAVITNIRAADRNPKWKQIKNVQFFYFQRLQSQNRRAKLQMDLISPFEKTLYIDADSVIQKHGVESFVKLLDIAPMAFNWRITFYPGEKIWNIYARCMKLSGVSKPISVYNGGIVAFTKTPDTRGFFSEWLRIWELFGRGREMPPLNCAIKKTQIHCAHFPLLYFADNARHDDCIIQHNYNKDFNKRFNIPAWVDYKPFDGNKSDFRLEVDPT